MRTLAFVFIMTLSTFTLADYGDMNPGTCAPSGIFNKIKAKYDPLGFWVRMYIDSLEGIKTLSGESVGENWDGPESHCLISNKAGSRGYQECMMALRNTLHYWVRCNAHAKQMCRMHGGYC